MPDGPSFDIVDEPNLDQRHADGGTDLRPTSAVVIGDNDEPTFADSYQAMPGPRNAEHH
ncbi:hypothetical protein D3C87_2049830 [compost metagenome]